MLGISAVHANDYSLEIGYNEISYPYNISQTVKDAIPYPHINNLDIIASNGSVAKHINGEWYGSLHLFEPGTTYGLFVNNSFLRSPKMDSNSSINCNASGERIFLKSSFISPVTSNLDFSNSVVFIKLSYKIMIKITSIEL